MSKIAAGRDFLAALVAMGIVPAETRRVVIDASMSGAIALYVELWGTEDLLRVEPQAALRGATVKIVAAAPAGEATASVMFRPSPTMTVDVAGLPAQEGAE